MSAAPGNNAPTQLEFTQAMTDFKVMFPDVDADVIEAVLRANNGAVDVTIDHLLAISADNEAIKAEDANADQPPAYINHPPSYQQATNEAVTDDLINLGGATGGLDSPMKPEDLVSEFANLDCQASSSSTSATQKTEVKHAYSHPKRQEAEAEEQSLQESPKNLMPTQQQLHEIYEENLRLREEARGGSDSKTRNQYLEDERIALMLQNEEFMAELQRDSEFMSALEMEQERAFYEMQQKSGAASGASVPNKKMDSEEFRDKLKNMGKTSKKKFAQMAAMFSRRKSAAKQLLGHAAAPSKDNLLLNAEPLVNEDDSDAEENDSKKTPTKGKYTSFS